MYLCSTYVSTPVCSCRHTFVKHPWKDTRRWEFGSHGQRGRGRLNFTINAFFFKIVEICLHFLLKIKTFGNHNKRIYPMRLGKSKYSSIQPFLPLRRKKKILLVTSVWRETNVACLYTMTLLQRYLNAKDIWGLSGKSPAIVNITRTVSWHQCNHAAKESGLECSCMNNVQFTVLVRGDGACHWCGMCTVWLLHSKWQRQ